VEVLIAADMPLAPGDRPGHKAEKALHHLRRGRLVTIEVESHRSRRRERQIAEIVKRVRQALPGVHFTAHHWDRSRLLLTFYPPGVKVPRTALIGTLDPPLGHP
jgi:hypothetical protein